MTDIQGRGYILAATASYLREAAGQQRADQVCAELSPELQQTLRTVQPGNWYSTKLFAEMNRAVVATLADGNEEKARAVLIDCGRHMGKVASGTFLKLLMRMLTPNLLVKKFPDVWKRDFSGGRIECNATDKNLTCSIFDLPGHDHIGPISAGWIGFNLEVMGKKVEQTIIRNWSLAEPRQDGVSFEFIWKN